MTTITDLVRNQTTAAQQTALEDETKNAFEPSRNHSPKYFKLLEQRRCLPISSLRQSFLDAYHSSQVVVVQSETGVGKSTQIPQMVLLDEWESGLKVACTQPRRLAATEVAQRVAEEMDVPLGGTTVGYGVRFDKNIGRTTRLGYLTDGYLLQLGLNDKLFSQFACIIVDEAHERTAPTDLLLALIKRAMKSRGDLKLVIMSATLDAQKFLSYFDGSVLFKVSGRLFPVDIVYHTKAPRDYMQDALAIAHRILTTTKTGDLLIFVATVDQAETAAGALGVAHPEVRVYPLYAAQTMKEQLPAVSAATPGQRRCVVATSVAETSLTIDGIVYVIDTGVAKIPSYNPRAKMSMLLTGPITKGAARQRAGRAGRTQKGVCYRVYTEKAFHDCALSASPPGILLENVISTVLTVLSAGHNPARFDYLEPPHPEAYLSALETLRDLDFVSADGAITAEGKIAARLPVHPMWWRAIRVASRYGCVVEILGIAALSSTMNPIFSRPARQTLVASVAHAVFADRTSDHLTLLNAFDAFLQLKKRYADAENWQEICEEWCHSFFLRKKVLEEAFKIREQLRQFVTQHGIASDPGSSDPTAKQHVRKALAQGLFINTARTIGSNNDHYTTVHGGQKALLSKTSGLVNLQHEWIVFNEFSFAGLPYLEVATAVDPLWLMDLDYFADDRFPVRRADAGYRQPDVKAAIDKAREAAR